MSQEEGLSNGEEERALDSVCMHMISEAFPDEKCGTFLETSSKVFQKLGGNCNHYNLRFQKFKRVINFIHSHRQCFSLTGPLVQLQAE